MTLFQTPLTAEQMQHLRESRAQPTIARETIAPRRSIFAAIESAWIKAPLMIGLLLFLNTTAAGILLKLIFS